jgi:transposase-like protein
MAENLVAVRTFLWVTEAEVAACTLRAHGIEPLVTDKGLLSWCPYFSLAVGGFRLKVKESDAANARQILRLVCGEDVADCPNCGSTDVSTGWRSGRGMFILSVWFLVPHQPLKRAWSCESCGCKWKSRSGTKLTSAGLVWAVVALIVLRIILGIWPGF